MNQAPILWLHHHTQEPDLLLNGEDGTRINCIYESIVHGRKQGDVRIPCMTMDDSSLYEPDKEVVLRFLGKDTPTEILQTGFRARLHRVAKDIMFGDLTDADAQAMGYTSAKALLQAKERRYPIVKKLWEPETLTVTEVRFEVLERLEGLAI